MWTDRAARVLRSSWRGSNGRNYDLGARGSERTVVFAHGMVMKTLMWLQTAEAVEIEQESMADFLRFGREVVVANCAILEIEIGGGGKLGLVSPPSMEHLPLELRTE